MFRLLRFVFCLAGCLGAFAALPAQITPTPPAARGIDTKDTRLLSFPAVSRDHIAFIYAGDLWAAGLDGKNAKRLTTGQSISSAPVFSPDGSLIAFSGNYDGNLDAYVVPVAGGSPRRLTWHPDPDIVQDFTPDGSAVLFTSPRATYTRRYMQLYKVPVQGGVEEPLKIPNAYKAAYAPDGARLAYTPLREPFLQWKRYRGGTVSTINICRLSDYGVEKVPQPASRCNDTDPMWIGETLYFRSDRDGEFNLYRLDPRSHEVKKLTSHADFPVLSARAGGGKIIYEQAGWLHVFDPKTAKSNRLVVGVAADLPEIRTRFASGANWARAVSLSPSGSRAAMEFRGEIVTVPAEKGSARNLTNTPGANDRSPAWSPDGKNIAYFSDETGEYELVIRAQDGSGEPRRFKIQGAGFYELPAWSPDSKKIAFWDNSRTVWWVDAATGVAHKAGSNVMYEPDDNHNTIHWSPDSRWLTFTLTGQSNFRIVFLHDSQSEKTFPVTDGLSDAYSPVFDASGKYLYFAASTSTGPLRDWFALSSADVRATSALYIAVLRKDLPSPLAPESDEEKAAGTAAGADAGTAKPADTRVDTDGIQQRILALPVPAGDIDALETGTDGQLYYLVAATPPSPYVDAPPQRSLHLFDLGKRKDETLIENADLYQVSVDRKKLLYRAGEDFFVVAAGAKPAPGSGKLAVGSVEVKVDPGAEWSEIFDDAWRINRDYFYAPNMHGLDWPAMRQKYTQFLPHVPSRDALSRVMQWMFSELSVGHHGMFGGGDHPSQPKTVAGGLLGADYTIENGRYRFAKVYGGLNWTPSLRAPLTEPGVNVRAGEYLLAVNGKELRPPTNLYASFEDTANKQLQITIGPNPNGTGARTVTVVPIADDHALRSRDWVEGNLRKVDQASGGRIAYVYVPDTGGEGHEYFKRYFYPQVHKEAIILDERFNGGGNAADYYIDTLRRLPIANWHMRYGGELRTPASAIHGPKAMLIDENAGSGGDYLPWMFRKFKLGPLIGKRTWGGLVGILGFPVLMDGAVVTAPNFGIWTEDGWVVENEGVPPDIEVEQTPAEVIAGHDPQLEKAIQVVMDELKKNPPKTPVRPAFPVKR